MSKLVVYNSLKKEKEVFVTEKEGFVGMYVCGPTVYSDVHLGNCRTFISFDIIYRYLMHLGYKVRYVRNITDVGHLLDDGEDRMLKGAKAAKLEPMEVAQKYSNGFHDMMRIFNTLSPSIEPTATGHIPEQIEMVQQILDNGYGYISNGSVYFDTPKFSQATGSYGQLSGRVIDELIAESRDLKNQDDKRHPSDFAIWMKASEEHIMKWNSPWSVGFPGWHLECSAMSTKYLGKKFDIHGGGNDLKFPHHENEIAQNVGSCGCQPANYWLHTNMLLMNGRKMSKSDGNTISPEELFTGDSKHITKAYSPMVVKFFMLQSHYRSTLDLTDDALLAAEKGFKKLMEAAGKVHKLISTQDAQGAMDGEIQAIIDACYADMNDDFSTPKAIATLFDLVAKINSFADGKIDMASISCAKLEEMKVFMKTFLEDVLALKNDISADGNNTIVDGLMGLILDLRQTARTNKDWPTSDKIRDGLASINVQVKDGKDGTTWTA